MTTNETAVGHGWPRWNHSHNLSSCNPIIRMPEVTSKTWFRLTNLNKHRFINGRTWVQFWKTPSERLPLRSQQAKSISSHNGLCYCAPMRCYTYANGIKPLLVNPGKLIHNFSEISVFRIMNKVDFWKNHPNKSITPQK